jgi:hypothetical protein
MWRVQNDLVIIRCSKHDALNDEEAGTAPAIQFLWGGRGLVPPRVEHRA